MSIVQAMSNYIKHTILTATKPLWENLNITLSEEDIWNDLARTADGGIEATFFIKGLDNVVRKDFNSQVALLKANNPQIEEFKVKFKRPEKEVRFYIKYNRDNAVV